MTLRTDLRRALKRRFHGLWLSADFRRLWTSLTVTSFGAQVTNLALPLTAAILLEATPFQMGLLVALETLPFALVSLHAGVLIDRVRKRPIVVATTLARGLALLVIPLAAFTDWISIGVLYAVGFFCGIQNVIGGAAHQVLIAQLAGRKRLVEANAKITLGETGAALVGPGFAGLLIQALTAPFAILADAIAFLCATLMLRGLKLPHDVPHPGPRPGVMHEIAEGLKLVRGHPTLWSLAWLCALWQLLHHAQLAVLILFAARDLGLSAGAIGLVYVAGGLGCVAAATLAERLGARFGPGPTILYALLATGIAWQMYGLVGGSGWVATLALALVMLLFDFAAVTFGIQYLSLRQAITPDRLLGRMTATMRFLTVAAAPLGSLAGGMLATWIGLRATLLAVGALGLLLALGALLRSPVRRYVRLPAAAES
jgi:MFS family permease